MDADKIVKTLRCCAGNSCKGCPAYRGPQPCASGEMFGAAAELIEGLRELERLRDTLEHIAGMPIMELADAIARVKGCESA